ncbi:hypothetical protein ACQP2P_37095 [Dactylosporangium sp. CA-139114]|uniref:DUF7919 family protein n=1 Tax=Dactylosporangium sp. CA-139114 TaxID=3239931 RepID=UPI003D9696AA
MYYGEFTPYEDAHDEVWCDRSTGVHFLRYEPAYRRLNIGWLQAGRPWTAAAAPEGFAGHQRASADTAEIGVPADGNTAYAAPRLVGHYVIDHGYRPPQPFIDAVLASDPHSSRPTHGPEIRFPWIPSQARLRCVDDDDFWDDHTGT